MLFFPNRALPNEEAVGTDEPPLRDEEAKSEPEDGALEAVVGDSSDPGSPGSPPPSTRAARKATSPASANTAHGTAASPPKQMSPRRSVGAKPRFLTFTVGG